MSLFAFVRTALANLVQGPCTERYPQQRRTLPAGVRGSLVFDRATCVYCTLCAKKCPTGALKVDRPGREWTINRLRCISCDYCVQVCPKQSLRLDPVHMQPMRTRDRERHGAQKE